MSSTSEDRWAFGTGFSDPRDGIGLDAPTTGDALAVAQRCLMLGDDALVYSHRLQQWITRAPELEEETALANIALDLLGQARLLLSRAGHILGRDEDGLAFFRDEHEFRNVRFVEHADGDFAEVVGRLFLFATWRLALLQRLRASTDPALAAIAGRGAVELIYHRDYAAGWVIRLGDGTSLSRDRMRAGLGVQWSLVDELFEPDPVLSGLPEELADPVALRAEFDAAVDRVLAAATVPRSAEQRGTNDPVPRAERTGREGEHTAALSEILAEMQSVARAHPLGSW